MQLLCSGNSSAKSELSLHMVKYTCISHGNPIEIQDSNTSEHNRRQHNSPVAQQYSSATLVSLHFHSRDVKFSARFKYVIIFFYVLKLRKSETV